MTIDMTAVSPVAVAVVGLVATILAAVIAFVGTLTAAMVNAFAARSMAKANARRDYRVKALQPLLEHSAAMLSNLEAIEFVVNGADFSEAVGRINGHAPALSGLALLSGSDNLRESWETLRAAECACRNVVREIDRRQRAETPLSDVMEQHKAALSILRGATVDFHAAAEDFLF